MRSTEAPNLKQLHEFNDRAWRELRFYSREARTADRLLEFGLATIGILATSLILYGIYRALGAASSASVASIPALNLWLVGLGIVCGSLLTLSSFVIRRRAPEIPQFTDAEIEGALRALDWQPTTQRGSGIP